MAEYYNEPSSYPPAAPPQNSTMAIISLVAGIAGLTVFFFFGSIVAVITGHMAKKEIRNSGGTLSGDGLATGGLVTGYLGIALGVCGCIAFGLLFLIPLITAGAYSY